MKPLTYRELLEALQELTPEQLDMSVSILDTGSFEIYPIHDTMLLSECSQLVQQDIGDVIEENQPLLLM